MEAGESGFWTVLGTDERQALAGMARRRSIGHGTLFCQEGDRTSTVLVLLSGYVRIMNLTPDGRDVVVGVRGPGDIVGELAAIDRQPRSATIEALDDLEVLELRGPQFAQLCQRQSTIAWTLLRVQSARLREVGQWLNTTGGAVIRRVAAQLVQLAAQHGVRRGDDIDVCVPATQAELAMTTAISRESWARATRDLRRQGVISTGRRRVTIHRLPELRRLAH